ncbi:MAG: phosphoesterase [Pirellulales bacterium]
MVEVQTEQVLVVPTEVFHRLGHFQGFTRDVEKYLDELFDPEHTSYRPRHEVEEDPSFKQLIPYCIFRYLPDNSIFQYTRGAGQGEGRLHAKRSIGIGGHISLCDTESDVHPYDEGMRRELDEEVVIDTEFRERCVGLINDDESDVGRVHLGVVHIFDVRGPQVRAREDDIVDAGFQPISQLLESVDQFETWSQICLDALFSRSR